MNGLFKTIQSIFRFHLKHFITDNVDERRQFFRNRTRKPSNRPNRPLSAPNRPNGPNRTNNNQRSTSVNQVNQNQRKFLRSKNNNSKNLKFQYPFL